MLPEGIESLHPHYAISWRNNWMLRHSDYPDLMEKYENPIQHACEVKEGRVWVANGWCKPEGFCDSAWDSISPFVMTLAHGGGISMTAG